MPAAREGGAVVALYLGRGSEEYNAGVDYCPGCGRDRRHLLRVRSLRVEIGPWQWHLCRRYSRVCTGCGREERLPEPPLQWPLPGEEEAAAEPGAGPAGEVGGPAGAGEPGVGGAGGPEPGEPVRGPRYRELARRMGYLLSPLGVRERQRLVEEAAPGAGGLFLEHAGHLARELVRQAVALREPEVRDPQALERALADLLFAFAWEGYLAYAAWAQLQGAVPAAGRRVRDLAEFRRRVAPRAYRRAEWGRAEAPPELVAWFWDRSATAFPRLQEAGHPFAPRLRPALEKAARDALHLGYGVAAAEGRFAPAPAPGAAPGASAAPHPEEPPSPGPAAHGTSGP